MQPAEFTREWLAGSPASQLNEHVGAQAHLIDLCRVLGVPELAERERQRFLRARTVAGMAKRVPENVLLCMTVSPSPDRIVARPGFEKQLAERTLTKLYNQRPAWLAPVHAALDAAVAAGYGWPDWTPQMSDDDILRRLLAPNLARAKT